MGDIKLYPCTIGDKIVLVCNDVGIPLSPAAIEANKELGKIKIGDKVSWKNTRCVGGGYGLVSLGAQGYVFDITERHIYTIRVIYDTIYIINGFIKSSLGSLGFEILDPANEDTPLQLPSRRIRNYDDYTVDSYIPAGRDKITRLVSKDGRSSKSFIDSSDRYDYFVDHDIHGKECGVDVFKQSGRPEEFIFKPKGGIF